MTPEEIKAGHTYEMDDEFSRTVVSTHGGELTYRDCYGVSECSVAYFARHAVRDVTPAPESGQGEKVAQAQSQGASCGDGAADLTANEWLQIEMAAKGCVSGTAQEWPALMVAIEKLRGKPVSLVASAAWLQGFCEGAMSMRRTPPAADAVKGDLLAALHGLLNALPSATTHPAIKAARAAIAKAEAAE